LVTPGTNIFAIIISINLLLISSKAFCDEKEQAKEHFLKGKTLVEERAYEKAIVELQASYELNPVPIVLYNIAICFDELHQYADALKHYRLFIAQTNGGSEEMIKSVSSRIKHLSQLIGLLKISVTEEGAEILVDNKMVGHTPMEAFFVETGSHDLIIRKTGYPEIKKKIKIVSGATTELSFVMSTSESSFVDESDIVKSKRKRTKAMKALGWVSVGLGGALLVASVGTGGKALSLSNDLENKCPDKQCGPASHADVDQMNSLALSSDVLLGVGIAVTLTGMLLLIMDKKMKSQKEQRPSISLTIPAGLFLSLSF